MSEIIMDPIHPGEILLEEFMKPLGVSQSGLAIALRVPHQRIHELVYDSFGAAVTSSWTLQRGWPGCSKPRLCSG